MNDPYPNPRRPGPTSLSSYVSYALTGTLVGALLGCVLIASIGCAFNEPDPQKINVSKPAEVLPTKWKVASQGYFNAGYDNHQREILLITSPDGHKFVGITGVGVTELWTETRSSGKTTRTVTVEE